MIEKEYSTSRILCKREYGKDDLRAFLNIRQGKNIHVRNTNKYKIYPKRNTHPCNKDGYLNISDEFFDR